MAAFPHHVAYRITIAFNSFRVCMLNITATGHCVFCIIDKQWNARDLLWYSLLRQTLSELSLIIGLWKMARYVLHDK